MSRRIRSADPQAAVAPDKVQAYFDNIVGYIPGDIVAAWIAITGVLASSATPRPGARWIMFALLLVITPLWTWRHTREPGKPAATTQIVMSTIAFIVWVYALGGPFATVGLWQPLYGSLAIIVFTLLAGLVRPNAT